MAARTSVAAVDLGASSGRVVLGEVGARTLRIETLARFPNGPVRLPDGLHWDVPALFDRTLDGLTEAVRRAGDDLAGIGIDSWAVDYGLLRDGRLLGLPYHYRDEIRAGGVEVAHARMPFEELHARNGLQFLPFTTLYQLAADPLAELADRLLLVPDLLAHWLTGRTVTERTNASTTGLLDPRTGEWDRDLVDTLGLPGRLLGELVDPGVPVGGLLPYVAERIGSDVPVTTVGSHDTASAVAAVPMQGGSSAYISCGTWGLVGVELEAPLLTAAARKQNFTNERGVDGRVRFLTNVMGLWLLSETTRTWRRGGVGTSLAELLTAAAAVTEPVPVIDVQDPRFLPPGDMPARIDAWCREHDVAPPASRPALVRCIVESLAEAFAVAVQRAADLAGHDVQTVHVVGGGALNALLCQVIADRSGRRVVAGPVEATALGNVLVQGRAAGAVAGDLEVLRDLVARTQPLERYQPRTGLR